MSTDQLQDKVSELGANVIGSKARWVIAGWATPIAHTRESNYFDVGYERAKQDLLIRLENELGIKL